MTGSWEEIDHLTKRLPVPGGWIYCHTFAPAMIDPHISLVFVPDPGRVNLVQTRHPAGMGPR